MNKKAVITQNMSVAEKLDYYMEPEPNSGCWLWIGATNHFGYGLLTIMGESYRAHRLSWEVHNSPIPKGMFVCHKCDTPACINPDHLFLGTSKDNMLDASRKGRTLIGEKNSQCKLTEEQAVNIFHDMRTASVIAKQYKISKNTVYKIKSGENWDHLKLFEKSGKKKWKPVEEHMRDLMIENKINAVTVDDSKILDECGKRCAHTKLAGIAGRKKYYEIMRYLSRSNLFNVELIDVPVKRKGPQKICQATLKGQR